MRNVSYIGHVAIYEMLLGSNRKGMTMPTKKKIVEKIKSYSKCPFCKKAGKCTSGKYQSYICTNKNCKGHKKEYMYI